MPAFSSLGDLSGYLEDRSDVRVVDAPIPLSAFYDGGSVDYGPAWRAQPAVRKVVGFIARHLASIPLHVYDRVSDTDRVRVRDGALAAVVHRPSSAPAMTRYRFWESVLIDGLIADRWCVMKVALDDGGVELARVPAYRTRFNADGLGRIDSVSTWIDGREVRLDPAKFVIDHGYSERGGNGTSPLITMKHLLDEAREAVEYRRQMWKRGARIPGVVEREKPWPKSGEARERFISSLRAYQQGGGQEGATLLLEDGMTYKAADSFNPQEIGDLEGRRLTDVEVCSAYYIAPELLGIRQGNYSNVDAYRQMLWSVSLGPYIDAWQGSLTVLVDELAPGSDLYIEANVESKLRGSFEEQSRYLQTSTGAPYLTRNEARARQNLAGIEGGDELVVPLNVLVGGQASPTDSGTQNLAGRTAAGRKSRAPRTHETKYEQVLRAFFVRQRKSVQSALGGKAAPDWWDGDRWDTELAGDLYALAVQTAAQVGQATAVALGFEPGDYDADRTLAFLAATTKRSAVGINTFTRDRIEAKLADQGDDDSPVAAAGEVFDVAEGSRTTALAIAAVTTMSGFATLEAGKQLGAGTKTWRTGSNPRPEHAAMDGETVALDEDFSNGLAWPGDASGSADDLANCNCELEINGG